jgi:hypothetical protein
MHYASNALKIARASRKPVHARSMISSIGDSGLLQTAHQVATLRRIVSIGWGGGSGRGMGIGGGSVIGGGRDGSAAGSASSKSNIAPRRAVQTSQPHSRELDHKFRMRLRSIAAIWRAFIGLRVITW